MTGFPPLAGACAQEKIQDESARSDFIYRVNLGRADDVRLLMRQGASPNQLSGEGVPVLCLAAARFDPEGVHVVRALREAGANVNARDARGQTALFYAARSGNIESIRYLMENDIDSYALDNNGDVARNAAHKAGQRDAVKAIDDFIQNQTAELTRAYRMRTPDTADKPRHVPASPAPSPSPEPSESINDVPPPPAETQAPPAEAPSPPQQEASPPSAAAEAAPEPPPLQGQAPAAPETPEEKADRIKEETAQHIYDLAFNVCAFQYWSYCGSVKQSVDLDKEEMVMAIDSSRGAAERLKTTLLRSYEMPPAMLESITDSAQRRIYKELNGMASNRDRHEKGVGKRDDMLERCEFIARQWGSKAPVRLNDPENASRDRNGARGGGKSKGGSGLSGGANKKGRAAKGGGSRRGNRRGAREDDQMLNFNDGPDNI